MKFALLGLPGAGKKTFFSLLTEQSGAEPESQVTMHGLLKRKGVRREGDTLVGTAPIHDERVVALSKIFDPEKTVFADNTIALCPDIVTGSGDRKWLEAARRCDLLCVLLRDFLNDPSSGPGGSANAAGERSAIEAELILADMELIENRMKRLEKEKRSARSSSQDYEQLALEKISGALESQSGLFPLALEEEYLAPVKSLGLLALKPALWACNVDENRLAEGSVSGEFGLSVSCRIEQEIMELGSDDERMAYLRELGVAASGLERLNAAAYDALGLMSFYTVGKDEVRAWTVRKGSTAPKAAGKVHSDIERGFIRVEIIKFDDMIACGGEAAAKAAGKMQVKGRDYVIEDGDICHFLFNV